MSNLDFSNVTTWVFDLDNTLYPPSARLFDEISDRMESWIVRKLNVAPSHAKMLRKTYWEQHGTTLAGLMAEHQTDPWEFLLDVHDVSMAALEHNPALAQLIRDLPGRRIVYTNGDAPYANRVLSASGLSGIFDAIYGIEHAQWHPKPARTAFDRVFALDGLDPKTAVMFEDDDRNLEIPHQLGMRTVHVAPHPVDGDHIHHHTSDLTGFLSQIML